MSINQSNLSSAKYGYDFVVATTQESINATMKEYLYTTKFQILRKYWTQDANGNAVDISYEDLMKQTNNTDPLKVAAWTSGDPMNTDIENINNSNFYFAFEAAIGIPADMEPKDIPDIITLQEDSQSVLFNLMCSTFTIVSCNFGRHGLTSFSNITQPADKPWLFTSIVALKNIFNNKNLPKDVHDQLNNFGPDAFSVQQLIFDLDNASIESTPEISGLAPSTPAYNLVSQVFLNTYFKEMKTKAQPVLNYTIVKNTPEKDCQSTLKLTNIELEISPYVDPLTSTKNNKNLNTLNYLCETDGNTLPPAVPFTWNWVEQANEASFHGAIAINRNTFANYFKDQLTSYISKNCYKTFVRVWLSGALDTTVNYSWQLTRNQTPIITIPQTGSEVLTYSYSSTYSDDAGLDGDMGAMTLSSSLNASVSFVNNTIVIKQTLLIHVHVRSMQSSESWNAINRTITDTYTLAVDQYGKLTSSFNSKPEDNSDKAPSANWFINLFTGLNDLVNDVDKWNKDFIATSFQDLPLNLAQKFVFPGGKTFTFKDVSFSDNQDLVSCITYIEPSRIKI